jgi:hypothetical protein
MQCHITEDIYIHHCENLKFHIQFNQHPLWEFMSLIFISAINLTPINKIFPMKYCQIVSEHSKNLN